MLLFQHSHDFYLLAGAAGGFIVKTLFKKFLGDACTNAFDWFVRRYIIKRERRLAIWLHHKLHHHGRNALLCEVGDCAKVRRTWKAR